MSVSTSIKRMDYCCYWSNGTGKSNVLEALAIIFRDLIQKERIPAFAYELKYEIGSGINKKYVTIQADPDLEKDKFVFSYTLFQTILEPLDNEQSCVNLVELKQSDLFEAEHKPNIDPKEQSTDFPKPISVSFAKFTAVIVNFYRDLSLVTILV